MATNGESVEMHKYAARKKDMLFEKLHLFQKSPGNSERFYRPSVKYSIQNC